MDARPLSFVLLNFYVSFTGFIMLNLLIAVVCESLSAMKYSSKDDDPVQEVNYAADDAIGLTEGAHDSTFVSITEAKFDAIKTVTDEVKKTQSEIREILQAIMERLPPT